MGRGTRPLDTPVSLPPLAHLHQVLTKIKGLNVLIARATNSALSIFANNGYVKKVVYIVLMNKFEIKSSRKNTETIKPCDHLKTTICVRTEEGILSAS